jgi:hypothetical protein
MFKSPLSKADIKAISKDTNKNSGVNRTFPLSDLPAQTTHYTYTTHPPTAHPHRHSHGHHTNTHPDTHTFTETHEHTLTGAHAHSHKHTTHSHASRHTLHTHAYLRAPPHMPVHTHLHRHTLTHTRHLLRLLLGHN